MRKRTIAALFLLALLAGSYAFREQILWSLGQYLVAVEPPQKADVAVVLGGDLRGNRILKAAQLVQHGYVPKVLVSGVSGIYGSSEAQLAIEYAVRHGAPREAFINEHDDVLNTSDEATYDIEMMRRLNVHSYLLVTSDFHTKRASRIFRRRAPDLEMHAVGAPDPYWNEGRWWTSREGRKTWLYEAMKSVAVHFGM